MSVAQHAFHATTPLAVPPVAQHRHLAARAALLAHSDVAGRTAPRLATQAARPDAEHSSWPLHVLVLLYASSLPESSRRRRVLRCRSTERH